MSADDWVRIYQASAPAFESHRGMVVMTTLLYAGFIVFCFVAMYFNFKQTKRKLVIVVSALPALMMAFLIYNNLSSYYANPFSVSGKIVKKWIHKQKHLAQMLTVNVSAATEFSSAGKVQDRPDQIGERDFRLSDEQLYKNCKEGDAVVLLIHGGGPYAQLVGDKVLLAK